MDNGSQYLLSFKQPKSAEHWVEKTDWDFADAQGFALVDYSGKLLECTYSATYHHYVLEEIKETLKYDLSESEIVKNLIEKATLSGGKDNVSAVVLKIKAEKM